MAMIEMLENRHYFWKKKKKKKSEACREIPQQHGGKETIGHQQRNIQNTKSKLVLNKTGPSMPPPYWSIFKEWVK